MDWRPRVWVAHVAGQDVSDGERWGDLHYLVEGNADVFGASRLAAAIAEQLALSDPRDYLLLCGSGVACALAAAAFAVQHGRINLLIYSHRDHRYEERTVLYAHAKEKSCLTPKETTGQRLS